MIIRAQRPKSNFTIIPNEVLNDARLSFKATGVLVYILSKPDGWRTLTTQLATAKKENEHAIRTAMQELEEAGYVHRWRYKDAKGRWKYETHVYDTPRQVVDNPVDNMGKLSPSTLDYPRLENPHD